jgi:hypothetical protein
VRFFHDAANFDRVAAVEVDRDGVMRGRRQFDEQGRAHGQQQRMRWFHDSSVE